MCIHTHIHAYVPISTSQEYTCVRTCVLTHLYTPGVQIATYMYIHAYVPISTPQDFFHTMEYSDKVERELDALQQSAVAYV